MPAPEPEPEPTPATQPPPVVEEAAPRPPGSAPTGLAVAERLTPGTPAAKIDHGEREQRDRETRLLSLANIASVREQLDRLVDLSQVTPADAPPDTAARNTGTVSFDATPAPIEPDTAEAAPAEDAAPQPLRFSDQLAAASTSAIRRDAEALLAALGVPTESPAPEPARIPLRRTP